MNNEEYSNSINSSKRLRDSEEEEGDLQDFNGCDIKKK